jgi:hypothetical protein
MNPLIETRMVRMKTATKKEGQNRFNTMKQIHHEEIGRSGVEIGEILKGDYSIKGLDLGCRKYDIKGVLGEILSFCEVISR